MENLLFPSLRRSQGPLLVTGHTGFKGAWLIQLLKIIGVDAIGYALPPQENSLYARANLQGLIPEKFEDIRNQDVLSKFISKHKPSQIIHLAAQPLVLKSYQEPYETFSVNVLGTANLLEIAFQNEMINSIGIVTTDKVYENLNLNRRFKETDPLKGKDPYSASKVATESVITAWQQIAKVVGGPRVISLRGGNVIGGGDFAENRLLPDLVRTYINHENLEIRNPKSTRPWQHVLDLLWGYLLAMEKSLEQEVSSSYNFGPFEESLSVKKVVEIFKSTWPEIDNLVDFNRNDAAVEVESQFLELDATKAKRDLGWEPVWSQEEAIHLTAKWWRATVIKSQDIEKVTQREIREFLEYKKDSK